MICYEARQDYFIRSPSVLLSGASVEIQIARIFRIATILVATNFEGRLIPKLHKCDGLSMICP